jgi:hypothetical protein
MVKLESNIRIIHDFYKAPYTIMTLYGFLKPNIDKYSREDLLDLRDYYTYNGTKAWDDYQGVINLVTDTLNDRLLKVWTEE